MIAPLFGSEIKSGPPTFHGSLVYCMTDQDDDCVWVARCLKGEAAAFEPLVERYQRVLFAVALRLLRNYDDAKDATQNAFIRAYEHLDSFDPNRRFFSWIYRIAVNESLNLRRARRAPHTSESVLEVGGGQTEAVEARERAALLEHALAKLTDEYREVVVLRYYGELSYEEISEALGVPEKTVKSRLFSARQRLAAELGH
jgi:RNA polymerase sigma-70 factor (ECF subfamily)